MAVDTAPLPISFRRLAWSNLAAQSAEQIGLAAVPLVAVLYFQAGSAATGLLQAAQTLPFLLLALPLGLLVDQMSRRRLMTVAEILRAMALAAVLGLAAAGWLTLPGLAILGFVGASGTVAYSVAAPALVPALVAKDQLGRANGRIELARSLAFAAGPALGGALVGWAGGPSAFALAAALSCLAAFLLHGLDEPARRNAPRRRPLEELKEGANFVFSHPLLRPILLTAVVFNTAFFLLQAVYVVHAVTRLGLSASGVGATLAAYGTGMVAGALLSSKLLRRWRFGTIIIVGPMFGLASSAVMAATIWLPSGALAGLSFFLLGAGPILWTISSTTLRQVVTPQHMLGRVSAILTTATYGARPAGALLGALLGGSFGPQACLLAALGGFALQALIVLLSPLSALPDTDSLPAKA